MEPPPPNGFSRQLLTLRNMDMKLGTHTQVPNTNTQAKFQGHSLTCVVFKVIEPKM